MSNNKLSVEQRIQKDHVWLMKNPKYCLYSGILMVGKTTVDDDVPTACTNGRDTAYGREFMSKLPDKERRGVILHENLHKAFRHTTVWKHLYKDWPQVANMACDYVINILIVDSDPNGVDVALPAEGLLDYKFRGLDAGEVFRRLKQEAKDNNSINVKTVGDQQGKDVPVVKGQPGAGGMDEHDWESAEGMSNEEREQLARDVDQALRQGAILAGKMSANVPREIADLTEAKVDWREAMREFVTSFCQDKDEATWRRPSRRWIGEDVYMPSMIGESVGRIVVGIDMSGSIGPEEIGEFLSELKKICETVKPEGIDLLYWDTRVCQHEKYEQDQLDNLLSSTKPRGGGGTDPQCIVDHIIKHKIKAECAVVLTDGYVSSWGEGWPCPTLWGITTDIVSPIGKTVRID
jgi:predicted metal-dependent peptidase